MWLGTVENREKKYNISWSRELKVCEFEMISKKKRGQSL